MGYLPHYLRSDEARPSYDDVQFQVIRSPRHQHDGQAAHAALHQLPDLQLARHRLSVPRRAGDQDGLHPGGRLLSRFLRRARQPHADLRRSRRRAQRGRRRRYAHLQLYRNLASIRLRLRQFCRAQDHFLRRSDLRSAGRALRRDELRRRPPCRRRYAHAPDRPCARGAGAHGHALSRYRLRPHRRGR